METQVRQLTPRFFDASVQELDKKFAAKFVDDHRKLKAAVHMCQHLAYKSQSNSLDQAQEEAQGCFQPLLLIRRHANVLLDNNLKEYQRCLQDAEQFKSKMKGYDTARWNCLSDYKNELKARVPQM